MKAQTVITHALDQAVGPVCMRPGMGVSAAPAPSPVRPGVSLAKPGDMITPQVLIMDAGTVQGWDTVARVVPSLVKGAVCGWCDDAATREATTHGGHTDRMCVRHAYVWGRFVEAYAVRPAPGLSGALVIVEPR